MRGSAQRYICIEVKSYPPKCLRSLGVGTFQSPPSVVFLGKEPSSNFDCVSHLSNNEK
jgi:hypothetical protein